jgi:hypothetical protein
MSYKTIASLIPDHYRREILLTNMITRAQATANDQSMYYLFTVWKNYVESGPDITLECNACLSRILKNYQELLPALIEMEKSSRRLDKV